MEMFAWQTRIVEDLADSANVYRRKTVANQSRITTISLAMLVALVGAFVISGSAAGQPDRVVIIRSVGAAGTAIEGACYFVDRSRTGDLSMGVCDNGNGDVQFDVPLTDLDPEVGTIRIKVPNDDYMIRVAEDLLGYEVVPNQIGVTEADMSEALSRGHPVSLTFMFERRALTGDVNTDLAMLESRIAELEGLVSRQQQQIEAELGEPFKGFPLPLEMGIDIMPFGGSYFVRIPEDKHLTIICVRASESFNGDLYLSCGWTQEEVRFPLS